jgi:hypothetical protein
MLLDSPRCGILGDLPFQAGALMQPAAAHAASTHTASRPGTSSTVAHHMRLTPKRAPYTTGQNRARATEITAVDAAAVSGASPRARTPSNCKPPSPQMTVIRSVSMLRSTMTMYVIMYHCECCVLWQTCS